MDTDIEMNKKPEYQYVEKELSWLAFNDRVLQEAENEATPPIQRLRYLGIFSNNLDEFYRVRVADVSRLAAFSSSSVDKEKFQQLLEDIQIRTVQLQDKFDQIYSDVLKALRKRKIYLIDEKQLEPHQQKFVENFFEQKVLPELDPVMLEQGKPFPSLLDGYIYLAVKLLDGDQVRYAVVDVPTDRVDRFVQIPQRTKGRNKGERVFIVLENIIRHCLPQTFRGVFDIKEASAYTIKITLDAELEMGEGINQSLIDKVSQSLQKRQRNDLERFIYDEEMPEDLLAFIKRSLKLGKYDSLMPGGRYHNAKDFMDFPSVGPKYLELKSLPQLPLPGLDSNKTNVSETIRERDTLLYYPYHPFDTVIDLLKTAAVDPAVKTIQISLYRVASKSRICDALLSAVANNKEVTAVVELQARFDEAANIDWANRLAQGGVNVIFGVPGLKVHSKLILIGRQEGGSMKYYTHVGTGNFNEKTAKIYTDFSLLTYDQQIGEDAAKVFDFISYNYRRHSLEKLLVSPYSLRPALTSRIEREIGNARLGLSAEIFFKCNNLVDKQIIDLLYEASRAGVRVRIICRGMFSLIAGVPGMSENIEAISIVDRFLEHPRVYIFHNAGDPEYFISSADLMTRNLDHRVEVTAPITDDNLKNRIQDIMDIQWCDNVKARDLDAEQSNRQRLNDVQGNIRSQEVIHKYLKSGKVPVALQRAKKRWAVDLSESAAERKKALAAKGSSGKAGRKSKGRKKG